MDNSIFNNKIDAYIIFGASNRFYFTRLETSFGCVILTPAEKVFITDFRYENDARANLSEDFTILSSTFAGLYDTISRECKRLKVKSIGYEEDVLTVADFKLLKAALEGFTLKPAGHVLEELRSVKSDDEIALIAAAQVIAQNALKKIVPLIKVGVTEREISAELTYEMIKGGADKPSFDTIIAFGENSALPHHQPSHKKLEKNDLILIDMGVRAAGYCSDMTRTFCLGEPAEQLKVIHSIVAEAQAYALKNIKAGMTAHEADSLAREFITANGYGKEFGHTLGHGVGVDIHEYPRVGAGSTQVLKENMIITVEPGIYIEGLGGVRIEDLVVVKNDGIVNLTNFDKNINL